MLNSYIEITSNISQTFVEIKVKDNGIGIPEKHLSNIFEPFQRFHNRRDYKGSGLGLATCAKIAERFGGKISVTSEVGKGTVFSFNLMLAQTENYSKRKEEELLVSMG